MHQKSDVLLDCVSHILSQDDPRKSPIPHNLHHSQSEKRVHSSMKCSSPYKRAKSCLCILGQFSLVSHVDNCVSESDLSVRFESWFVKVRKYHSLSVIMLSIQVDSSLKNTESYLLSQSTPTREVWRCLHSCVVMILEGGFEQHKHVDFLIKSSKSQLDDVPYSSWHVVKSKILL